ncbi:hypothetical protein [Agromyces seonyuensis]|nr:hypothetical protein [Agromyces seonyuensis]
MRPRRSSSGDGGNDVIVLRSCLMLLPGSSRLLPAPAYVAAG